MGSWQRSWLVPSVPEGAAGPDLAGVTLRVARLSVGYHDAAG